MFHRMVAVLALALVAHAAPGVAISTKDMIRENCKAQWGSDKSLVRSCYRNERAAHAAIVELRKRYRSGSDQRKIIVYCERENPGAIVGVDWSMANICANQYLREYRRLKGKIKN